MERTQKYVLIVGIVGFGQNEAPQKFPVGMEAQRGPSVNRLWKGVPKGQKGIDELNIWLQHERYLLSVEHDPERRKYHTTRVEVFEQEIERREGK